MSHAGVGSAASRFVHRKDSTRDERDTLTRNTPPARPRSNTQQRQSEMWSSEAETEADRHQRLESLRIKKKSNTFNRDRGPPTSMAEDVAGVAANVAQQVTRQDSQQPQRRTVAFDDTQSIAGFSDDSDLGTVEQGTGTVAQQNNIVPFGTDYNSPDQELWAVVDQDHFNQQYGEPVYNPYGPDYRGSALPAYGSFMAEEQVARAARNEEGMPQRSFHERQIRPEYAPRDHEGSQREVYNQEELEKSRQKHEQLQDELETRVLYVPTGTPSREAKDARRADPQPAKHSATIKHQPFEAAKKSTSAAIRSKSLPNDSDQQMVNFNDGLNTKASSYVGDSDPNTSPPSEASTARNRPHVDLDYDPNTLKTMTYSSLDNQAFTQDPRAPVQGPVVDEHGVPLTLSRKLTNLNRMQESDISSMFAAQTDAERDETGTWFMHKFQDNMKKLMDVRVERRKIALRYEMEVKKRQALVEKRTEGIEEDLKDLKKKGAALINMRGDPPSH